VNPLLERVVSIFDENGDSEIEFKEFIRALSIFSDKGNKEEKLKCTPSFYQFYLLMILLVAFRVYDIDNDGKISNGELFQVLKMMVGENLNDTQARCLPFNKKTDS